jgi:hypothetical protein
MNASQNQKNYGWVFLKDSQGNYIYGLPGGGTVAVDMITHSPEDWWEPPCAPAKCIGEVTDFVGHGPNYEPPACRYVKDLQKDLVDFKVKKFDSQISPEIGQKIFNRLKEWYPNLPEILAGHIIHGSESFQKKTKPIRPVCTPEVCWCYDTVAAGFFRRFGGPKSPAACVWFDEQEGTWSWRYRQQSGDAKSLHEAKKAVLAIERGA